jgi:hypothetical protein
MQTIPLHPGSGQWSYADLVGSRGLTHLSEGQKDGFGISRKQNAAGGGINSPHSGWRILRLSRKQLDVFMSVAYFVIGFSPITALAFAIIGVFPLSLSTLLIVLPATVLGVGLALWFPTYGKIALKGLMIGLIAVFLYDCMRAPFIIAGVWGDFIPKINTLLFNTTQPNWIVGYVWRYLGDGGFMGMAFTVAYCVLKPRMNIRIAALGFGLAIWVCLVVTLVVAPHGQEMLFKLTPTTLSLSLLGHLIYGISIGMLLPYVCREQVTRAEPGKATTGFSQDVWEEPAEEEETVKLPPLLRVRPAWEQKTVPLLVS